MRGKIALEEHFAIEGTLGDSERYAIDGTWTDLRARLLDVQDIRLREMDTHGIEFAIISLNAPAVQAIPDRALAVEIAVKANDALAEEVAKRPDRFAGFAALPMQDPDAAIAELRRCVNDLGFKGALVNGFTQQDVADSVVYYDGPAYRPFWAAMAGLEVPFYLHPRLPLSSRTEMFDGHQWLMGPTWAFARETSLHALRLLGSGLFDELPSLQLILGHMGERLPYDLWRLDHRLKKSPRDIRAKKTMREYMHANVHITTSGNFHDPTFHCCLAEMGVERMMFSADYPFEFTADAATWFDNADMDEDVRLRVGRTNAIKLFGLDLD